MKQARKQNKLFIKKTMKDLLNDCKITNIIHQRMKSIEYR